MPKVSVIVPVYNVEPYLKRSMDCLLNQTLKDLEFICIDDCSTDNSLEILKEYEAKDCRFKIITSDKNNGAAIARNKGLDVAQGEYLGFIDPDDAIDLNYYEELYKKAKETDADIVKCLRKTINSDGTSSVSGLNKKIKKNKYYFSYEWTTAIYKSKMIYDNNIRFIPEIIKAQDVVFLNSVVLCANSIELIDNTKYWYYLRGNSLNSSQISLEKIQSACKAVEIIIENINKSRLFEQDIKTYINLFNSRMSSLFITYYQNDTDEARFECIKTLISIYKKCKEKKLLNKSFKYKNFLKLVKTEDILNIQKLLNKFSSHSEFDLYYGYGLMEKLFSIKSQKINNKKVKMLTILGIKFKIN